LRQRQAELDDRGAVVLVVSFDAARRVRGYCRRFAAPFRCLTDEARAAYRAYHLGRASWLRTLTPRALAPYITLYLRRRGRRRGPFRPLEGADLRQMGGDFVVAPNGRLALAYASHDPADRPSADQILAVIR
jgi:hypothetical protein